MLLNGVLIPKLLNILLASCFLINFDFLLPHITLDNIIILPWLLFAITRSLLCVFFCT